MSNRRNDNRYHIRLITGLSLLVFLNISCFTIVTSFTKSNFLTAVQMSPTFQATYDQRPYFFLYGISSLCFIAFYLVYHMLSQKITFEQRLKRDVLSLMLCSLVLYVVSTLFPGFEKRFIPAAVYFVIYDILDDLIVLQTWTLINYYINIRESKKIQNLFLFSGGVAAFISGRYIVGTVPQGNQIVFLVLVFCFSGMGYLILNYIFSFRSSRIPAAVSTARVSLKTLAESRKKYSIIKSIIYVTVLVGIFNLFFKVLFDTQVNIHYPLDYANTTGGVLVVEKPGVAAPASIKGAPDPKTEFIGKYKAFISLVQVILHLVFIYFFSRLWLNGRILLLYPFLLIPNLIFILWVFFTTGTGYEDLLFWGTVFACGVNELIRRVIFDSAYQLLIFSIPETLCDALRMYSRLLIKPVVVILLCLFFVIIPARTSPVPVYCTMLILFLLAMGYLASRLSGDYVSCLRTSVLRRVQLGSVFESLVNMRTNYIVEQYQKVVAEIEDRFAYLYILSIIRNNYSRELNFILDEMLENTDREVRLETISVLEELGVLELIGHIESLFIRETDPQLKEACLKVIKKWRPSNSEVVHQLMNLDLPIRFRKYVLAIAHRNGQSELKGRVGQEIADLLRSSEKEEVLGGIWLVGELQLSHLRHEVKTHFDMAGPSAYEFILRTAASLNDFELFSDYINHIGYERIRDYGTLNQNLAVFGNRSLDIISDMMTSIRLSSSHLKLEKCLRTLQLIPSQNSLDFLAEVLFSFDVPIVRREALNCIAKIRTTNPFVDQGVFWKMLPSEINQCKKYSHYYRAVKLYNYDSLLLIELARNIEHRVWATFKIMDMLYPDAAVLDSYYRITQTSQLYGGSDFLSAKSIEYLETLVKDEHSEILRLLECFVFEKGFLSDVLSMPGPPIKVDDVYRQIIMHSYHWLKLSAMLDIPPGVGKHFGTILKEAVNMIPVLEKVDFLRDVPLFKGFSIMEMTLIAQIAEDVGFEAGHVLFKLGDPGDALYIILEGQVDLVNRSGERLTIARPPQSFGEVSLLDNKGRSATAVCIDDCRFLRISGSDFQELLEEYPILYKNIVFILTGWLREEKAWSIEMS